MIAPGQRVGKYLIERRLGAGGMGEVYRGFDETLQRPVAIKVLPEADALSPEARARMLREARAASALHHPNIVTIHEVGEDDERTYIVMELVDGQTLAEVVKQRGPLPVADAATLVRQVGAALETAHQAGFVHRDIKTANLMLDRHGVVKVLDFGLSKRVSGEAPTPAVPAVNVTVPARRSVAVTGDAATVQAPNRPPIGDDLTVAGHGMGTAGCSAPELMDGKPSDARADVFSLGVVLYELLVGRRPYDGDSWDAVRAQIGKRDYRPARDQGVPEAVDAIIVRALEPDPAARWPSAAALTAALDQAIAPARRRGHGRLIAAVAVAAVATTAGTAYLVRRQRDGGRVASPPVPIDAAAAVVALAPDAADPVDAGPAGPVIAPLTRTGACAQRPAFVDEDTVVFDVTDGGGGVDLWKVSLASGTAGRLLAGPTHDCCAAPGRRAGELAFIRRDLDDASGSAVATLDLATGEVSPLTAGEHRGVVAAGAAYLYLTGDQRELRQVSTAGNQPVADVSAARPSALAIDRDGRRVVLTGDGEQARAALCVVELAAPTMTCKPAHRPQPVRADFGSAGAIYYASHDGLRVLTADGTDRIAVPEAQPSGGLAVSPGGAHLVYSACTYRSTVMQSGGGELATAPFEELEGLAAGPGGLLALVESTDRLIVRFPDGTIKPLGSGPGTTLREPSFDASGTQLAVVVDDGGGSAVFAGAIADGSLRKLGDGRDLERPLFTRDGAIVFTRGRSVLRVRPGDSEEILPTPGPRRALAIDRTRDRLLLLADDGALTWWDLAAGAEAAGPALTTDDGAIPTDALIAPGGGTLVVVDDRGRLWRGPLGDGWRPAEVRVKDPAGSTRVGLALDDDGQVLVVTQRLRGELWRVDPPPGTSW